MISKITPSHYRTLGLSFLPNFLYCCTYVISCETVFLSKYTHGITTNIMSYIIFTFGSKLLTPQAIKCRSSTILHFASDHHELDCTHPLLSDKQANESNCSWPAHCTNHLAPGTLLSFSAMYNNLFAKLAFNTENYYMLSHTVVSGKFHIHISLIFGISHC